MKTRKPRKRFNRFVKKLSDLYNKPYHEVEAIYYNQNCNVQDTRLILNIGASC